MMAAVEQWGVDVESAGPADSVGGMQPSLVARPRTTDEVSSVLRSAAESGLAVIPRGAGTTLAWGPPPERADVVLDTTGLAGVIEHVAGDLVVSVGAGTRLADLQASLAPAGQRLAIDGDLGASTIGGLVAHGLAGPGRLAYGTLRDLLIGATFVRADGVVAHSGGKVVKNVAGYDLGKLLHGSWGTLAVLTEATLRLHPQPEANRWITVADADPSAVASLTRIVLHSQVVPAAVEIDRPPGEPATLTVLLEGRTATVDVRASTLAALLGATADVRDAAPSWWGRRPAEGPDRTRDGVVLMRLTSEVAGLERLLAALDLAGTASGLDVHLRGSAGVGSVLAAVIPTGRRAATGAAATEPGVAAVTDLVSRLRRGAGGWGGTVVVLDGPAEVMGSVDVWGPVPALDLMRRVKERFDPDRRLSPGRFVGGI